MDRPIETELTRAARTAVDNADKIQQDMEEFQEEDFVPQKVEQEKTSKAHNKLRKTRKAERQRRKKAKRKK
jgi:hypothetical protein